MLGGANKHINLKIGCLTLLVILLFGYMVSNSKSDKIEHDETNIEIQDIQTSINDQLTKQASNMQNKLNEQQKLQRNALKANSDKNQHIQELLSKRLLEQLELINIQKEQQVRFQSQLAEQLKLIQNQLQTPSNTGGLSTDSTTINESYESPIPFTAITPFETTPRIPRTYGIADFGKIPIDCKNKAIMNTIFQNGATGMGYAYTCHNGGPVGPEVTYITPAKPRTENGSRNFANHNIDCGTNKVLTGWNMVLNSDNTTQIRYKCAPNLRKTPYTSRQVSTGWNADAGGDPIFLDRQHIICSGEEALSRIQLELNPTDNTQRYNLTCVK